jgi:hybrid polyketide synthase/nonribosomal peptide synthetase FtdB
VPPPNDEGGHLAGDILYDANSFKENEIRQLSHHFTNILAAVTGDVNIKIPGIFFLTEEEKKQLLVDFNDKIGDFSRDRTIYHFIEDFARKTPDSVALVFHDEKITYRYLNAGANILAGQLRNHGVGEDVPVAILLIRSPQMMTCIIAAWKAGGAYIPLSMEYPVHRVHEILNDSQAGVLVTETGYVHPKNLGKSPGTMIIKLDKPGKTQVDETGNSNLEVNMDNLSYVIYTSGTTGKPKGVMIEHRGMMNHIRIKINDLELDSTSIVVQNAPSTFDISLWQFFAALIPGGQTVIYPDELIMQPERLLAQLVKDRVTIFEVVPSYLSVLQYVKQSQLAPLPLKYLLVTGEEIKFSLVKKWFEYYPHIKMINAYGPTEASDDITHYMMNKPPDTEQVPIGAPLQNFKIYIFDRYMNLCPVGVKGELCVSGVGVGRGYLNRPELTAEKFYRSYRSYKSYIPKKIYRTGDLACWLPDGNIEYFGRIDQQVKVRGYRIELGEIESQLLRHESINEVVVMVKEVGGVDAGGVNLINIYVLISVPIANRQYRD